LIEATECILAANAHFLQQQFSSEAKNHSAKCFLGKILEKLRFLLDANSNPSFPSKLDPRHSVPFEDCRGKRKFSVVVAFKMAQLMAAVHFTPAIKLPPCLALHNFSTCLKTIFHLTAKLSISEWTKTLAGK